MKPRRTHTSNHAMEYPGGTEDQTLWMTIVREPDRSITQRSTWELSYEERQAVAAGANIELSVWFTGSGHPPVAMGITDVPLGKPPDPRNGPADHSG